jgi:hypothetical protein
MMINTSNINSLLEPGLYVSKPKVKLPVKAKQIKKVKTKKIR